MKTRYGKNHSTAITVKLQQLLRIQSHSQTDGKDTASGGASNHVEVIRDWEAKRFFQGCKNRRRESTLYAAAVQCQDSKRDAIRDTTTNQRQPGKLITNGLDDAANVLFCGQASVGGIVQTVFQRPYNFRMIPYIVTTGTAQATKKEARDSA